MPVRSNIAANLGPTGLCPFWFWNDALSADEIVSQIGDFQLHGVDGFVIHPRVGLPWNLGWMSEGLLELMEVAIEEAAERGMRVILYDEGMYPSGSSSGMVVARDATLGCRCLLERHADEPGRVDAVELFRGKRPDGVEVVIEDAPADSYIRGLHYLCDDFSRASPIPVGWTKSHDQAWRDPPEDEPPAGDILNPRTTDIVIELVYRPFADRFARHIGKTVWGIFTDEPNPLGKCRTKGALPFTKGIFHELKRITGEDFSTSLARLFSDEQLRERYHRAVRLRLQETWYAPLSRFCESRGLLLCGHPDRGDEIGAQRFFQCPGQDLVWRFVEPDRPTAIEGAESTQAKCSSSAMLHHERRFNSNEFAGAYGEATRFEEVKWLADWCLVRGVNLLIPHAFYYSVRGPRRHERPPQVGPHTAAWDDGRFEKFARHCATISALNTDALPICDVAILTDDRTPWRAARACFRHQVDFNYLELQQILTHPHYVDEYGVRIPTAVGEMRYRHLILDPDTHVAPEYREAIERIRKTNRLFEPKPCNDDRASMDAWDQALAMQLHDAGASALRVKDRTPGLRYRHLIKQLPADDGARGADSLVAWLLFNETSEAIDTEIWIKPPIQTNATAVSNGPREQQRIVRWVDTTLGVNGLADCTNETDKTNARVADDSGWVRLTLAGWEMKVLIATRGV